MARDTEGVGEAEARGKGLRPLWGEQSSQCTGLQLAHEIAMVTKSCADSPV